MGFVYADIELINNDDLALSRRFIIGEEEVKRMTVRMLVNSGAYSLCINEEIQAQLQFPFVKKRKAQTADGRIEEFDLVGSVKLRFKNRQKECQAVVLPGSAEPLLGSIPLENMDVIIDPLREQLLVNPDHPYFPQMKLKSVNAIDEFGKKIPL